MARITSVNADAGIAKASTWGTAVAPTAKLRYLSLAVETEAEVLRLRGHQTIQQRTIRLGRQNVTVTATLPLTFGGEWLMLWALLAGTNSAPSEQTIGEGDYLQNLDIADLHSLFCSLSWKGETEVAYEIPSVKWVQATIQGAENGQGVVIFQGIGDRLLHTGSGATASVANLEALTHNQTEEDVVFNSTNLYHRYGDYSTGTPLSSTHDQETKSFELIIQRPCTPDHCFRGASTPYTLEPYQSGITIGSMQFTIAALDDAKTDPLLNFRNETYKANEIFVDGSQIGAGVNTSLKMQVPYGKIVKPSGLGIAGQATRSRPSVTLELGAPATAQNGMSGVLSLVRLVTIGTRTTAYI